MADDLGYETLGANGGQSYQTPHLDRLVASGVRFERCNVQPRTPTRRTLRIAPCLTRSICSLQAVGEDVVDFTPASHGMIPAVGEVVPPPGIPALPTPRYSVPEPRQRCSRQS
jgi:hypothetical protein